MRNSIGLPPEKSDGPDNPGHPDLRTPNQKWRDRKRRQRADVMYVSREMVSSLAYRSLKTPAAHVVLMAFLTKRQVELVRRPCTREYSWDIKNNGEITFTYGEARDKYGLSPAKFTRAIDDLIRVGFIGIEHSGLGLYKDATRYSLCDRWKLFGKPEYKAKTREKRKHGPGFRKGNRLGAKARREDFQQSPIVVEQQSPTTVGNLAHTPETALAGMETGCRSDGHNCYP